MKRTDIGSLTGLRFIAALSVAFSHSFLHLVPNQGLPAWYLLLASFAGFGMPLFFVLSGFVIQYNYGAWFSGGVRKASVARFLFYRFTRLYPLYITLLVLEYLINPYDEFPHLFHAFPYFITMTQTWVYQTIDKDSPGLCFSDFVDDGGRMVDQHRVGLLLRLSLPGPTIGEIAVAEGGLQHRSGHRHSSDLVAAINAHLCLNP